LPWNQRRERHAAGSTSELNRPAACLNIRPMPRTVSTQFDRSSTSSTPREYLLHGAAFGLLVLHGIWVPEKPCSKSVRRKSTSIQRSLYRIRYGEWKKNASGNHCCGLAARSRHHLSRERRGWRLDRICVAFKTGKLWECPTHVRCQASGRGATSFGCGTKTAPGEWSTDWTPTRLL
jgi:hypothetical protein